MHAGWNTLLCFQRSGPLGEPRGPVQPDTLRWALGDELGRSPLKPARIGAWERPILSLRLSAGPEAPDVMIVCDDARGIPSHECAAPAAAAPMLRSAGTLAQLGLHNALQHGGHSQSQSLKIWQRWRRSLALEQGIVHGDGLQLPA
ncbi:hypothetical protein ACCO45_013468 [Purpureocillium lilacinum]|uniref:Uncharacterized protein n=1 Tax=Purpureocillium lilacinum TaxID=33203 RepID=A0ACC4D665_PURLI